MLKIFFFFKLEIIILMNLNKLFFFFLNFSLFIEKIFQFCKKIIKGLFLFISVKIIIK
jgi:hypothetical protein